MFIFDISLNTSGSGKQRLPATNKWLSPKYHGPGENIIFEYLGKTTDYNDPKNWKKDFPEYNYSYESLQRLKDELNGEKNKLTPLRAEDGKLFDKVSSSCNKYDGLRGRFGYISKQFGGEIVTNAWMKMYECMSVIHPQIKKNSKSFSSFHVAEAPGNFVLAVNHYMKDHFPNTEWEWNANSYKDLYKPEFEYDEEGNRYRQKHTDYLVDSYGLMKKYPDNWKYGIDGDGDITSPGNIKSFASEISADFVTSDVKYVPPDNNYDEEEWQNIPVQLGHLLIALTTLKKGGSMMLKEFTYFEAPKMSHLYLAACCFKKLMVVKPVTSKAANSEVYLFGIDFKDNLDKDKIDKLMNIMRYVRFMADGESPAMFKKEDIPKEFVDRVVKLQEKLVSLQIPAIDVNIATFKEYVGQNVEFRDVCKDMDGIKYKTAKEWAKRFGVKRLDENHKML